MGDQRIALVTGGTSGIGKGLVEALAKSGVAVHFIGSSEAKGAALEQQLVALGHTGCRFVKCDLSSVKDTQAMARRFSAEVPHLDVLANCAGILPGPVFKASTEGVELSLAVALLSTFILSTELAPLLAKSANPRIINVGGSPGMMMKPQSFAKLNTKEGFKGVATGFESVHCKVVLTQILANRYPGVEVDVFNPGLVKGGAARNLVFPMSVAFSIVLMFANKESKLGVQLATPVASLRATGSFFTKPGAPPKPLVFEQPYMDELSAITDTLIAQALASH